jgi:2',3'-cyclic-nucleotide 2'-phosphodiesterase (5'-nucleotidase family)
MLLLFGACSTRYVIKEPEVSAGVIAIDSTLTLKSDSVSEAIIAPYRAAMEQEMNEILAYSEAAFTKDQPEGSLGDLVADIVLEMANRASLKQSGATFSMCLLNNGGLRSGLPKGAITTRNIFELMPFENKVVALQLTAGNTEKLCNYIAREGGMPVSGLRMKIKDEKAVNIQLSGKAFDPSLTYWVVTSDYLADGGDNMDFFKNPIQRIELPLKVREAIIEYLRSYTKEGKTLKPATDQRVQYE